MKNKWIKEIGEWLLCFIIAYAIYLVLNYFIGTIAGIKQASMYPTAKEGERVLISRRILFNKTISRGDIVTIEAPLDVEHEAPEASYTYNKGLNYFVHNVMGIGKLSYIKRVIGLPKEHIFISEDGSVYINDKKIEEKYLVDGLKTPRNGKYYDVYIPEGYVFVMGDNREGSKDSRAFGIIPIEKVEGKVIIRVWPFTRFGKI